MPSAKAKKRAARANMTLAERVQGSVRSLIKSTPSLSMDEVAAHMDMTPQEFEDFLQESQFWTLGDIEALSVALDRHPSISFWIVPGGVR